MNPKISNPSRRKPSCFGEFNCLINSKNPNYGKIRHAEECRFWEECEKRLWANKKTKKEDVEKISINPSRRDSWRDYQ